MIHDDHRIALRNGLRMALVVPVLFAVVWAVTGDDIPPLFAAFGSFTLAVFGNFGGPLRQRFLGYVYTTLVGVLLIVIGALAGPVLWVAVLVAALVGFALTTASALGGYVSVARAPLLLAYVLSAALRGGAGTIDGRVVGWVVGGLVAGIAAVTLWPIVLWSRVERLAARVCAQVADVLAGDGSLDTLGASVEELRGLQASRPEPRAEPTVRGHGLALLLVDLGRIDVFPGRVAMSEEHAAIDGPLIAATAALFRQVGEHLVGGGPPPDLVAYSLVRRNHFEAVVAGFGDATAARAEQVFPMRLLSFTAMNVCAHAIISHGGVPRVDDEDFAVDQFGADQGVRATSRRAWQSIGAATAPGSASFRWSVRSGVGVGAATLVAGLMDVQHAFWVALAVFAVLRSDAGGTARTAVEAVGGTLIGFLIAVALLAVSDGSRTALWVALPVVVFLAAWAGQAVHFIAGQAAFTLFVVVLFDLIAPGGWRTGLVRVEDVLIGAGTAVVVGGLLWPGGAARQVGGLCADALRLEAEAFVAAVAELAGGVSSGAARMRARVASTHARRALGVALGEHRRRAVSAAVCANAVWASSVFDLGCSASSVLARRYGPIAANTGADRLSDGAGEVCRRTDVLADRLERGGTDITLAEGLTATQRPASPGDVAGLSGVDTARVVWTQCWVAELEDVLARFGA